MPSRPPEPPSEPPFDPRYDPRAPSYPDERGSSYDNRYDPRGPTDYDRQPGRDPQWRADDPRYARVDRGGAMPPPPVAPRDPAYGGRDLPPGGAVAPRRRLPLWVILAGLVALALVAFFAFGLTRGGPGQDRLDGNSIASGGSRPAATPAQRCSSRQTYDQVKAELFRQGAATRGSDGATFDRLAAYATLRMEAPVLKRQDDNVGTLVCSARASLDLPPGVEVAGGRRTLTAALDYSLQDAADGSGQVVTLAGADPITIPLATLSRSSSGETAAGSSTDNQASTNESAGAGLSPPPAVVPQAPSAPPAPPRAAPPVTPVAPRPIAPQPSTAAGASPGFPCRYARTRGEIAVCGDPGLAALDRQMTAVYVSALRDLPPETDALLRRTRDRFLAFRDRCGSNACMAGAYRDRIREINDIREGRWQP